MLKTEITHEVLARLKFLKDTNELSVLVGPTHKLLQPMKCAVTGQMLYDQGHLIEGLGYCSTEVAAIMVIRGLVDYTDTALHVQKIAVEFAKQAERKKANVDSFIEKLNRSENTEQEVTKEIPTVLPSLEPLSERMKSDEELTLSLVPVSAPKTASKPPFVFQPRPDEKEKPQTLTLKKGDKVDVLSLPSGTVLKFEQDAQPEFDRTPVGAGFDMSQVPAMDRDLVRTQFDVDNGITTRGVTMRPFTGSVIRKQADFDINQLPEGEREEFEGYAGGTIEIRNASDAQAYESRFSSAEIAEAVEAEFAEDDIREFGKVITDEDLKRQKGLERDGNGPRKISLPAKCLGEPAARKF